VKYDNASKVMTIDIVPDFINILKSTLSFNKTKSNRWWINFDVVCDGSIVNAEDIKKETKNHRLQKIEKAKAKGLWQEELKNVMTTDEKLNAHNARLDKLNQAITFLTNEVFCLSNLEKLQEHLLAFN